MSYNLVVCKSIPVPCPSKTKGIRKTDRSLGIDINLLVLRETVRVRRRGKIIVEVMAAKYPLSNWCLSSDYLVDTYVFEVYMMVLLGKQFYL